MAIAFDSLQRASFDGIEFPVMEMTVSGGIRDHVHEYPHSPGGAPEKLGRKLYTFKITAPFLQGLKKYPKLWPEGATFLRQSFDQEISADLVIPTLGTITAYALNWSEKTSSHLRSGVMVDMEFREDDSNEYLSGELVTTSQADVASNVTNLVLELKLAGMKDDLFTSIQNAANQIIALKDQAERYANVIAAKADGLSRLCQEADEALQPLNNPAMWRVLQSLHNLWASSNELNKDVLNLAQPTQLFTTTATMSVVTVSTILYGDSSQAVNLMRQNALSDPLSIPSGTSLLYYPKAA